MQNIYNILVSILGESKQGSYSEFCDQYQFNCPHCRDENDGEFDGKYNLEVSFSKMLTHCWKCNNSGKVSKLILKYGNRDLLKQYWDELNYIKECKLYDISSISDLQETSSPESSYISLPKTFTPIKLNEYIPNKLREYLSKRRITQDIIDYYNIGYTKWDGEDKNIRSRIILPSYDKNGFLNYWVGRDFTGYEKRTKYFNVKADKNSIVLNEKLINYDSDIILVEGAIDSIYYPQAIPLLGKVLTKDTAIFDNLYKKCHATITIVLDGDTNIDETKRIYSLLNNGKLRNKIYYVRLGGNEIPFKDFGEIYESCGKIGIIKTLRNRKQFKEIELLI